MSVKDFWWGKAKEAAAIVGWFPTVILSQWQWETGNFTSSNFTKNNNIAGQTWLPYMGLAAKGTARPAAEGGYYVRYDDAVTGYVDFIQSNGRYAKVKNETTEEAQIRAIAAAGWAVDPNYANGLINTLNGNKLQGYILEVDELKLDAGVATTVINTWLKPSWEAAKQSGDLSQCDYIAWLASEIRKSAGIPTEV